MREILFRGKRLDNGEWAYGVPLQYSAGQIGIVKCTKETRVLPYEEDFTFYAVEELFSPKVDPATVGQYTGLTDKNGVKIFEGDIIKTKKFGKIRGHVNVNDFDVFEVIYEQQMFRLIKKNRGFGLVDDGYSKFEVIGNIHDNPELMEGGAGYAGKNREAELPPLGHQLGEVWPGGRKALP